MNSKWFFQKSLSLKNLSNKPITLVISWIVLFTWISKLITLIPLCFLNDYRSCPAFSYRRRKSFLPRMDRSCSKRTSKLWWFHRASSSSILKKLERNSSFSHLWVLGFPKDLVHKQMPWLVHWKTCSLYGEKTRINHFQTSLTSIFRDATIMMNGYVLCQDLKGEGLFSFKEQVFQFWVLLDQTSFFL